MLDNRLNAPYWSLRTVFGVVPLVAGLDKFTNLLTDWRQYLNPLAERMLPMSGSTFMRVVGVIEILVGLAVLTRWTRLGAYVASVWLVLIALNLLTSGHFLDVAVRDLSMAVGAFALARLEEAREKVGASARAPSLTPAAART
jgi:uncharacterized membrane protein YphA (DoxX/SURF4 family)